MKQRAIAILFLIATPACMESLAQQGILLMDQAEQILARDEQSEIPSAVFEELQDLASHPLNLNTATEKEMENAGIFTSFQIHMIIEYRERYGVLISIYELASIGGFRPARIKEITPYITIEPGKIYNHKKSSTNTIYVFAGRVYPDAAGYQNPEFGEKPPPYAGSPWKTSLRVKAGSDKRISCGLAYGKDPGEKGFSGVRPQYLTGFVRYRGNRFIEQCILGSYRLHHGMGLVQGTDQFTSPGSDLSKPMKFSSLKPYAGLSKSSSHRGLAFSLNLSPVKISIWSSLKIMDMSARNIPSPLGSVDWESQMRESGLYRTSTEEGGRGLGYMGNAGIQAAIRHKALFVGAQFSLSGCGLTKKGRDSLQIVAAPTIQNAMSIYWRWQPGKFETFGEYSPERMERSAILTGFRYQFNDFLNGGLLGHWYGTAHRETFSSAYASGSHISNEKGLMLHVHAEPARFFVADMAVELFTYPAPRHLTRVSSSGLKFNLTLQSSGAEHISWRIRMIKKIWQTTPQGDQPGFRPLVRHTLSRLDGRVVFQPTDIFQWQTRLVATIEPAGKSIHGYAALLQIRIHFLRKMNIASQFVVFNIPDWNHRIYLYEPGLYHHFNFPVYYGNGQKLSLVFSLKSGSGVTMEGKFSRIVYHDRNQISSGNDLLEGDRKNEIAIQMRLNL